MWHAEPVEFAPGWLARLARDARPDARAVAFIRVHEASCADAHPALRDRTAEVAAMLRGLVGDLGADVSEETRTGREWHAGSGPDGFQAVGAAFSHRFRLLVA